jgi:hypothetical protein
MARFCSDTRGTAAIEFALLAPVLVALALGLADGVRRNLMLIDLDAAAAAGAAFAQAQGPDAAAITAAMAAATNTAHVAHVEILACDGKRAGCAGLPQGRYARVIAEAELASLLDPAGDRLLTATALVRLP